MCHLCNSEHDLSLIHSFLGAADFPALKAAMEATDTFARENILHRDAKGKAAPKGGPFGAQNYVMNIATGQILQAGDLCANAVVQTGIVSNHAEAMAMQPDQLEKWRDAVIDVGPKDALMVQISSAESCPSCYAKQVIWHSRMAADGLIRHGQAITLFNATYSDTLQKAGFNDLPYAMAALARTLNAEHPGLIVKTNDIDWNDLPNPVKQRFLDHTYAASGDVVEGMSVVYREGTSELPGLIAGGIDRRPPSALVYGDPFATSEVQAIRNKCRQDRDNGIFESWATPGTLYTLTPEIGALMHAEAQWGSIKDVHIIRNAPESVQRIKPTQEAAGLSNADFYKASTAGYNAIGAGVKVVRLESENTAQPLWPSVLAEVMGESGHNAHYDGLAGHEALKSVSNEYVHRFTAPVAQALIAAL